MSSVYQIYRSTTLGTTLEETLRELVHRQMITPRIVHYILGVFDRIISEKLNSVSTKGKNQPSLIFKGHLLSYRACDQVWTLIFDSLILTSNTDSSFNISLNGQSEKIKIIACPATSNSQDHHQNQSVSHKKFKSA